MSDNNQLPEPELGYIQTDKSNQPAFSARQMREALQARAQVQGEPVYWEWRHLSTHPNTVDFGQWSEWQRVEARNAIHTIEGALAEFRAYIAQGYKYELRALYTTPQPAHATQAEVTDEQRKTVDQIMEQAQVFASAWALVGGRFDSGDALDDAHEAKEELREIVSRAILAQRPERVPMTGEQWTDVLGSAGPDLLDLAKQWSDNKVHVYQVVNEAEKIVKAAVLRGITAQAKKEPT